MQFAIQLLRLKRDRLTHFVPTSQLPCSWDGDGLLTTNVMPRLSTGVLALLAIGALVIGALLLLWPTGLVRHDDLAAIARARGYLFFFF